MEFDKIRGKKEAEIGALLPFLEARTYATGKRLSLLATSESPDFECAEEDGTLVGVERARITKGPIEAHWSLVLDGNDELDPYEAQELIVGMLARKEKARAERYSKKFDRCLLILALVEVSLQRLRAVVDELETDYQGHGFAEVWLVDYSGLDAYGNVEIYGLYPDQYWGMHLRPNADAKPFG